MAFGDIYQLSLVATGLGQTIRNTFFYQDVSVVEPTPNGLQVVVDLFVTEVVPLIRAVVSSSTTLQRVEGVDLFDPALLYDRVITDGAGLRGADPVSAFNAWSFSCPRRIRGMHRGAKRFGMVSEVDVANGAAIPTLVNADLKNLAAIMGKRLPSSDLVLLKVAQPVIVKRIKEVDAQGKVSYRLPANAAEAIWYEATDWTYDAFSTQNTRKPRRFA